MSNRVDLREALRLDGYSDIYIVTVGRYSQAVRKESAITGNRAPERIARSRYRGEEDAYETIARLYLRQSHGLTDDEARKVYLDHVRQWNEAAKEDEREMERVRNN